MVGSVGSSNGNAGLLSRLNGSRELESSVRQAQANPITPVRRSTGPDAQSGTSQSGTTDNSQSTSQTANRTTPSAQNVRQAADNKLGELVAGIASSRGDSARATLRNATEAAQDNPSSSTAAGTRDASREALRQTTAEGSAAFGAAFKLTSINRAGSRSDDLQQARQDLLDFVNKNGTDEQKKQAESLFKGDLQAAGSASGSTSTGSTARPTASGQPTQQTADAETSSGSNERLDRDRAALSRLTELNSSLRQQQSFGGASRGSLLNFFS
jgi:hypothetical protein